MAQYIVIFNSLPPQVVLQEVPEEVSLQFTITGCKVGCKGCHSTDIWDEQTGEPLTPVEFEYWLDKYQGLVSCVLFFGGEWQPRLLINLLKTAQKKGLKTCLYSGLNSVSNEITQHLNYLKVGPYDNKLGGLASKKTNQRFYDLDKQTLINHKFIQ